MPQIVGNLSKNSFKRKIKQSKPVYPLNVHFFRLFSPPIRSPIRPSVRPVHLCPPVRLLCPPVLSVHPLCLSVRPSVNSVHSIRPFCTVRRFVQSVRPPVHLLVCPSSLSINPDRPVGPSVQSIHLFFRPSLCPSSLSVRPIRLPINSPDGNENGKKSIR